MRLGEKLRYLREVEGTLRGLGREMTQQEVVRALKKELRQSISQSYLSQIESGARPHLTNATRMLLARFFKVHPGYLVDDPEGFHTELISDVRGIEDQLDLWLIDGAERFRRDPEISQALLRSPGTRIRASVCCCWTPSSILRGWRTVSFRCCGRNRRNSRRQAMEVRQAI